MKLHFRLALISTLIPCLPSHAQPVELRKILVLGQQAIGQPEGLEFDVIQSFTLNEQGMVALNAYISDRDTSTNFYNAMYLGTPEDGLEIYQNYGDAVPGFPPGPTFTRFESPNGFNDHGQFIFQALYAPDPFGVDITPASVFVDLDDTGPTPIATELRPVPAQPDGSYYYGMLYPQLNNAGEILFGASIFHPASPGGRNLLLSTIWGGGLMPIAATDTLVPWTNDGTEYDILTFNSAVLNNDGRVFFTVRTFRGDTTSANDRHLLVADRTGTVTVLAREGNLVADLPGDIRLPDLAQPTAAFEFGSGNEFVMRCDLLGDDVAPGTGTAILTNRGDGILRTILRQGDHIPGLADGETIGYLRSSYPQINIDSEIALISNTVSGSSAAIVTDVDDGVLTAVVNRGEQAPGFAPGVSYLMFQGLVMNDEGRIAFLARLSNNTSAIFVRDPGEVPRRVLWSGQMIDTGEPGAPDLRYAYDVGLGVLNNRGDLALRVRFNDFNDPVQVVGYYLANVDTVCAADTNRDGLLTPADFTAWIAAFHSQSAACDQNGDSLCTPADFTAWIANYNVGC